MIKLEDLQPNATIRGILPDTLVTIIMVVTDYVREECSRVEKPR